MIRTRLACTHGLRLVAVATALLWTGCGKDKERDAQTPGSAGSPGQPPPGQVRPTPEMPATWANISATDFLVHVANLDFPSGQGHQNVDRRCKPASAPECDNATADKKTKVDINPEKGAQELDPGGLKPNGHVIALLVNKGRAVEAKYSLPPNGQKVYWLIEGSLSRFVYVDAATMTKRDLPTFPYRQCNDSTMHLTRPPLEASFARCRNAPPGSIVDPLDFPVWISCLAGCCVAELEE